MYLGCIILIGNICPNVSLSRTILRGIMLVDIHSEDLSLDNLLEIVQCITINAYSLQSLHLLAAWVLR